MQVVETDIEHKPRVSLKGLKGNSKRRVQAANRFGWKCVWCSQMTRREMGYQNSATVEHLKPVSQGGKNNPQNLASACYRCNVTRGTTPVEKFAILSRSFEADTRSVEQVAAERKKLKHKAHATSYKLALKALRTNNPSLVSNNARALLLYNKMMAKSSSTPEPVPATVEAPLRLSWWNRLMQTLTSVGRSFVPLMG